MPRSTSYEGGREDSPPATYARQLSRSPGTGAMTFAAGSASAAEAAMRTMGTEVESTSTEVPLAAAAATPEVRA